MNRTNLAVILAAAGLAAACGSSNTGAAPTPAASAPAIYSVSPAIGATAGGTTVTITGANFQTGATVTFDGASATNVTVVSANQITAQSPTNTAAKFVDVRVANTDAQNATRAAAYLYCFASPTTHSQIVNSCPPAGVQTVTTSDAAIQPYLSGGSLPPLN